MISRNFILITLIFISQFVFCQGGKRIHGKIIAKDAVSQGVRIIDLDNGNETVSDENGEFEIQVQFKDSLTFSSNYLDSQRRIIRANDYRTASIIVEMTAKATQLDEVKIVKHPEYNGFQMGILSEPAKKYTPAERRLKTAGDFKPIQLIGLLFGQLPVDPIINAINGKTKMLKKELLIEREETLLSILKKTFDDDYYVKELKLKPDHIKGFQYYAIQDKNLVAALQSNNTALVSFVVIQLAFDYNNLQRNNKP